MRLQFCAVKSLCKHQYSTRNEKAFALWTELAPALVRCAPQVLADGSGVM